MLPGFNFDPTYFLGFMLGFVIGTTFHEFMHAYSAYRLGDDTAQRMGRITLNPFAHFDAFAGPVANLALAGALLPLYRFGDGVLPEQLTQVLGYMITINLWLFAFNLIPIPPLDGFNILSGILPNYWVVVMEPIRRYSLPILMGLIFVVPLAGRMFGMALNPVGAALNPIIAGLSRIFLG